jgi:hypothetical protein
MGFLEDHTNWAARFKTYVKPLYSGTYTITVNHDDGSHFIWNGVSRVNRYGAYRKFFDSFSVTLTEGIFYPFEIRYVQIAFGKSLGVRWSGPSTPYQVIPNSRYFILNTLDPFPIMWLWLALLDTPEQTQ